MGTRNPYATSLARTQYRHQVVPDKRAEVERSEALRELQRLGQEFDAHPR